MMNKRIQFLSNKEMNSALLVLRRTVQYRGNSTDFQLHYSYERLIINIIIDNCQPNVYIPVLF